MEPAAATGGDLDAILCRVDERIVAPDNTVMEADNSLALNIDVAWLDSARD